MMKLVILDMPCKNGTILTMDKDRLKSSTSFATTVEEIQDIEAQAFISSHKWEEVVAPINNHVDFTTLAQLCKYFKHATFNVDSNIEQTKELMQLICCLRPEMAGQIRKSFMLKKDILHYIA